MPEQIHHYHHAVSQPCRSILLLLKATNTPHVVKHVDIFKGEHKKPDFPHPFNNVPVMVQGDFVLTESVAIARYILNSGKAADHWYPTDPKKRARVDEFLSYHHGTIRKAGLDITMKCGLTPMASGKPCTKEDRKQVLEDFDKALDKFEGYFLKNGSCIAGDKVSIADVFAISEILQAAMGGTDFLAGHPKTQALVDKVKAATPYFDEVFKPFNDFLTK
ncbi:glutathione S-transferase theta-1-like isoform X1 [Apostichopus japonicus]|uniref:glutathione S-transferase theta-1-like isoform X1 n=1 Tax=Stichopus japonicus TaxID=307972 RepID=UPI003AB62C05